MAGQGGTVRAKITCCMSPRVTLTFQEAKSVGRFTGIGDSSPFLGESSQLYRFKTGYLPNDNCFMAWISIRTSHSTRARSTVGSLDGSLASASSLRKGGGVS